MIKNIQNKTSKKHYCYICKQGLHAFKPYQKGFKALPEFQKALQIVGSDLDNFLCPHCGCNDRERHLFMFLDKLDLWGIFKNNTLHFAPEKNIQSAIENTTTGKYVMADLFPTHEKIERIDITEINYPDQFFDAVICNHVLEHIPDLSKALSELLRVMKPGAHAILQAPYSNLLHQTFEDEGIQTDELRELIYGQCDHVRIFGKDFFHILESHGFQIKIMTHKETLPEIDSKYYGVNELEPFTLVSKPA